LSGFKGGYAGEVEMPEDIWWSGHWCWLGGNEERGREEKRQKSRGLKVDSEAMDKRV